MARLPSPAFPGLWLLPLLLTQVAAVPESLSGQSQQLPDPESCSVDEYRSAGHCCKPCPAGKHVKESCMIPHTQGQCVSCESGTFIRTANGLDYCLLCATCGDDQEMVAECSATRDRICQCRTGHFYHDPQSSEMCTRCTRCPPGIPVLQECNSTADAVCGSAASSQTGHWHWLLILVIILVCTVPIVLRLGCCLWKKVKSGRYPSEKPRCERPLLKQLTDPGESGAYRPSSTHQAETTGCLPV